ncbi:MAG: endonuclease [Thermoleophilia bacterium]|nr:endonuclease [Thermoleophilia bacterium]
MSAKETLPPVGGERVGERRARAARLLEALHATYPDTSVALHHETPFQLLIAVILSAQCTDERVNQVTPALFAAYPDSAAMAQATVEDLERLVQPTGFFRQKAKKLLAGAQRIEEVYGGVVPRTVAELTTIPGAARKTANVVISSCFPDHAEGIAIDTHAQRIARRLGWTRSWEPNRVEQDLTKLIDRSEWNHVTHLLIDHGRAICKAPKPLCDQCPLAIARDCPSFGRWDAARTPVRRTTRARPKP